MCSQLTSDLLELRAYEAGATTKLWQSRPLVHRQTSWKQI